MNIVYRTLFALLGGLSLICAVGLCLPFPQVTASLPPTGAFPLHIFLASFTAAISASLLWISISGELRMAAGGAIDLAVFYSGLLISQFLSPQRDSQHLLMGTFLCSAIVLVSLGIFLRFHRYPVENSQPMPWPVRISFGAFATVLLLVGTAVLLHIPNVFAWTLNPLSSALLGSFFLGSSCYFLYGLVFPRWHNASGQLWSFLAYDIVLIGPYLFHFAVVRPAQMPSLLVNTLLLVYSGALAIYYLFIKKETRFTHTIAWRRSPGNFWRRARNLEFVQSMSITSKKKNSQRGGKQNALAQ